LPDKHTPAQKPVKVIKHSFGFVMVVIPPNGNNVGQNASKLCFFALTFFYCRLGV